MAYEIKRTRGDVLASVPDYTIDSTSTSLQLVGRGVSNYGRIDISNLIQLLENAASATSPTPALEGQLWYNTTTDNLEVYDGTQWQTLVTTNKAVNQAITLSGDVGGNGTTTIVTHLNPPQALLNNGLSAGGTFEKITFDSKGRVINGVNLTTADLTAAAGTLLTINGTVISQNLTLKNGGGGGLAFADGTIQTTAAASLGFTPVRQGGGQGMYNNSLSLGWNGAGIIAQVDATPLYYLFSSATSPTLTLAANAYSTAAGGTGGKIIYNGAYLPQITVNGVTWPARFGRTAITETVARQDRGDFWRLYRSDWTDGTPLLIFDLLSGEISGIRNVITGSRNTDSGVVSGGYDMNAEFGKLPTTYVGKTGTQKMAGPLTVDGDITSNSRLIAALGAFGSGITNAAVLLGDFDYVAGPPGTFRITFPNGFMIQGSQVSVPCDGNGPQETYKQLFWPYTAGHLFAICNWDGNSPPATGNVSCRPIDNSQIGITVNGPANSAYGVTYLSCGV
jgi:hypothetical protein